MVYSLQTIRSQEPLIISFRLVLVEQIISPIYGGCVEAVIVQGEIEMTLLFKNWKKFQHYKERTPPWIKLHRTLLDDMDYYSMTPMSAKLLPLAWLLASENDGCLPSIEILSFRLRVTVKEIQKALTEWNQYFEGDASETLAWCKRDAIVETETETETETEKDIAATQATPPKVKKKTPPKTERKKDPEYEIWAEAFKQNRGIDYRSGTGDFVQLASLRKTVRLDGCWPKAIHHYFNSPLSKYTLADLCVRFDVFLHGPLNQYGKPVQAPLRDTIGQSPDPESDAPLSPAAIKKARELFGGLE
jgi:hypothetical protein